MKLSEYKGEKAIEVFANLLEPIAEMMGDGQLSKDIEENKSKAVIVANLMKNHPKSIIKVLAILDDADPETYEVNFVDIPVKLFELLNDKALTSLFTSRGQNGDRNPSGSATENITESEN